MKRLQLATLSCYVLVVLVLAITSLLDALTGREGTSQSVYSSWPFTLLWALLALLGMVYICRQRLWRQPATFLIHVSLFVILCGALTTRLFGAYGSIHIRTEKAVDVFVTSGGDFETMPFSLQLDTFHVSYYEGTSAPSDFISSVRIIDGEDGRIADGEEGRTGQVSMNHILSYRHYRFYQAGYDPDLRGSRLSVAFDPFGIAITYTGYALLLLGMVLFFFSRHTRFRQVVNRRAITYVVCVVVMVGIVVGVVVASQFGKGGLQPVLRSPLLPIHVGLILTAYVLLASIMVCGVCALVCPRRGEMFRAISLTMLYPAVFLLTAGIVVGSVWANVSWGRYWGWDAKEVWALITLMVYALPLHGASPRSGAGLGWFRDARHFHLYVVLAFLAVLMTYFGANYFIAGLHSYA